MQDTRSLLLETSFPNIYRSNLDTLQVNLGYLCNLSCTHCHVNAGPTRTELMEQGYEHLPEFLAEHNVVINASMPCYQEQNVDKQRGKGVYQDSIAGLKRLNDFGYGKEDSNLVLNLVYNPDEPILPPDQQSLKEDYQLALGGEHNIVFTDLFALANMPISRFGARLLAKNQFEDYMKLLRGSFSEENLNSVMCRSLVSVDYQGYIYDCDFNQMLMMQTLATDKPRPHLRDLFDRNLEGSPIAVGEHCYGCTAGQGSSCGGALA
jgi:radical SAM/Cys-rich protein